MVPSVATQTPDLLTPNEFRARFKGMIGRNTLYNAIRARRIKHIRLGRKILILGTEVRDWPLRESIGGDA